MTVAREPATGQAAQAHAIEASSPAEAAPLRRHLLPPSDGSRYRQLTLALGAGGDLSLTAHEMGASIRRPEGLGPATIAGRRARAPP